MRPFGLLLRMPIIIYEKYIFHLFKNPKFIKIKKRKLIYNIYNSMSSRICAFFKKILLPIMIMIHSRYYLTTLRSLAMC